LALRSLEDNFYGLGLNSCNDNILASLSNARKIKKLIIVIFSSIVFSCSVLCKFCVFFFFLFKGSSKCGLSTLLFHHQRPRAFPVAASQSWYSLAVAARKRRFGINSEVVPAPIENFPI